MRWNTENEDGTMVKLVDRPHKVVLPILGLGDYRFSRLIGFPTFKRELLDKLQVQLVAYADRIEVKAVVKVAQSLSRIIT